MPWSEGERFAGFTPAWAYPWLPVPASHRALAVDGQDRDPDSTLRFTRRLLALRRSEAALRHGTATELDLPAPLFGFERQAGARRVTLVCNLSEDPVPVPPGVLAGQAGLGGFDLAAGVLPAFGFALLAPVAARVREPA